jgi:predicted hydrolase (HD superfamily)
MKQPSFAAKVPREQLERGAEELGVEMNEHIQAVIDALAEHAEQLDIGPREGAAADAE